ncbi:MAG: hypothetical protein LBP92_02180 [Deltaproteobacteria bacterium]|jgi:hypothetical protein|nr:hypothetical protein [Deltaproteobacteria bacterium]
MPDSVPSPEDKPETWDQMPWSLEIPVPQEARPELLARLLAARPWWDPFITGLGLAIVHDPRGGLGSDEAAFGPELAKVKEIVSQLARGRHGEAKIKLHWRPGETQAHPAIGSLGPWRVCGPDQPGGGETGLLAPWPLRPSPRLRAWNNLAASGMADYLTPPPGAPETRGGRTLIFDEDPGPLAVMSLLLGSGQVEAVCSKSPRAAAAEELARLNGREDSLKVTLAGIPPWPRGLAAAWVGKFDLVVVNYSPYLATKFLKAAGSFLASDRSRLLLSGLHVGTQASLIIKAASRCGLSLLASSTEGDWTILSMVRRRQTGLPVWEWSPGDWVANLSEEDQEALAEADRLDGRRPIGGQLDLGDLGLEETDEPEPWFDPDLGLDLDPAALPRKDAAMGKGTGRETEETGDAGKTKWAGGQPQTEDPGPGHDSDGG